MKRLAILGGMTGIGARFVEHAQDEFSVKIYGRPEYNIFLPKTMMVLGRILQRTRPNVFVLNASGPIVLGKERYAYAQADTLKILWPFIKPLDLTLVIISSAGSWKVANKADPVLKLFRMAKCHLSATAIELCWKSLDDIQHKARTVLFEPSTMNPEIANNARIPCLTTDDAWRLIKLGIELELPFVRLGAQGAVK